MSEVYHRLATTQQAVDRRVHAGLGSTVANLMSWREVVPAKADVMYHAVCLEPVQGRAMAVGDDAVGPIAWYRAGWTHPWVDVSGRLPFDARGPALAVSCRQGDGWWIGGERGGGGWLAFSSDGRDWQSYTSLLTITQPVRVLAACDNEMWIGGDAGMLKVARAYVIDDLTAALGWSEPVRGVATVDCVRIMVVGGAEPIATQTVSYSGNSGLVWNNRTAQLGTTGPVYAVLAARPAEFIVGGHNVVARTGNTGLNWDSWVTPTMAQLLPCRALGIGRGGLVVGTDHGLYQVYDGGFSEVRLPVEDAVAGFNVDDRNALFVGRGVWSSMPGGVVEVYSLQRLETRLTASRWVSISGAVTTVVFYGRCQLTYLLVAGTGGLLTIYDNVTASGKNFQVGPGEYAPPYPLQFSNGLTVVTNLPTMRVVVGYIDGLNIW